MKNVLITGATSGIGMATAKLFARNGYFVFVNGRDKIKGQRVAKEVKGEFVKADVTVPSEVEKMFSVIKSLDVLVNNVGGIVGNDNFQKATIKDLEAGFSHNFFGAFFCAQQAVKIMKKGSIVNVASVSGFGISPAGPENIPIYSAAKSALLNLSQNLARILAPNIRVNSIIPGYTKTGSPNLYISLLILTRLNPQTLINRIISPQEVAEAIYLLATNEAITGTQFVVDGGMLTK